MAVAVRLLGQVELQVDGLVVPVERLQVRRLLAVLALQPRQPRATSTLVEDLWPADLPKDPLAALRVVASRLRGALGRDSRRLRSGPAGLCLDVEDTSVDAVRFQFELAQVHPGAPGELARIDAALGEWRGTPFGGAAGPHELDLMTNRLERLRAEAETRRAELLLELGATAKAVVTAASLVEADPVDERRSRVLAVALAREGRRPEALRVLRNTRRALREEFGLPPTALLAEAERLVLDADAPGPVAALAGPLVPASGILHGRDGVVDEVAAVLRADGPTVGVVLTGPPGIGKTAVVAAVAARLGLRTVYARGTHHENGDDGLAGALGATDELLTEVADQLTRRTLGSRQLLAALDHQLPPEERLLLVVDDVHWCAPPERQFLRDVLTSNERAGLRLLLTSRDPEGPDGNEELRTVLDALTRTERVRVVPLGALDRQSVRRLYVERTSRALTAAGLDDLVAFSGGNPYIVRSLADAGIVPDAFSGGPLPLVLRRLTDARLEGRPEDDVEVLELAAVLGEPIDVALVAVVAERPERHVAGAVDRAVAAGLLTADQRTIRFDHQLTRNALAGRVGPSRTRLAHRAAAEWSRVHRRDPVITARHVLGAADLVDASAQDDLLRGAEAAEDRAQYGVARQLFERAAELEDDPRRRLEIRRRLAWSTECGGDRAAADELYNRIEAEARTRRFVDLAARAALGGAAFGVVFGGTDSRLRRLADALADPPADDHLTLGLIVAYASELTVADRPVPTELLEWAERLATGDDADAALLTALSLYDANDRPSGAVTLDTIGELERLATTTGDLDTLLRAQERRVGGELRLGRVVEARTALDRLRTRVYTHPWPRYRWSVALYDAVLADLTAGPVDAERAARHALSVGRELAVPDARRAHAMFHVSVLHRRRELAVIEPFMRPYVQPTGQLVWRAMLAASLAERGETTESAALLREFLDGAGVTSRVFISVGLVAAARAASVLGLGDEAARCAALLEPWSGNLVIAGAGAACFGPADLARAEALRAAGREEAADEADDAARKLLAAAGATAWLAGPAEPAP